MKKLTKKNLDELAKKMPVLSKELQRSFIGGGNGAKDNPYTATEFNSLLGSGSWYGGFVQDLGFVAMETTVTPSGSYTSGGGTFVSAGDILYESNADNKSGFWGSLVETITGIVLNGTDAIIDVINTHGADSEIAKYFKQNPNIQLYKTQKRYTGNKGEIIYQDSYHDENGQLISTKIHR